MQFATVVLFVSSVMLACIASSTGDPGPNVTEANLSGSLRFSTSDINRISVPQLLGANATTSQEERMSFTSLVEGMLRFMSKIFSHFRAYKWIAIDKSADKILNHFHPKSTVKGDTFKLAQDFWDGLTQSDLRALLLFFEKNKKGLRAKAAFVEALSTKYGVTEMVEVLLKARDSEDKFRSEVATRLLDDLSWSWRNSGASVAEVFWRIYRPVGDELSGPKRDLLLDYMSRSGYEPSALSSFEAVADDLGGIEGKLSLLAVAKKLSGERGIIVQDVEETLLPMWAEKGKTLLDVLDSLKVPLDDISDPFFWDILFKYNRLVVKCGMKPMDVWEALRRFYGDGLFANAMLDARRKKDIDPAVAYLLKEDWLYELWALYVHGNVAKLTEKLRESNNVPKKG